MVALMGNGRTLVATVVIIVAILALIAGVMYMTMPAHSLPSFFPGHLTGRAGAGKHSARGLAGIVFGIVLLVIGVVIASTGRRRRYGRHMRY